MKFERPDVHKTRDVVVDDAGDHAAWSDILGNGLRDRRTAKQCNELAPQHIRSHAQETVS